MLRIRKMNNDTVKVNRFLAYGKSMNRTEPAKATAIYNEALTIAQKIKDENGIARAMFSISVLWS